MLGKAAQPAACISVLRLGCRDRWPSARLAPCTQLQSGSQLQHPRLHAAPAAAAQADFVWERKAAELYPPETRLLVGYGTWRVRRPPFAAAQLPVCCAAAGLSRGCCCWFSALAIVMYLQRAPRGTRAPLAWHQAAAAVVPAEGRAAWRTQCRPRPCTNGKIYSPLFQIHHPTPPHFLARPQALVRDANRRHASLVLPLAGRSCLYKFNHPHYYFECRLLALQWLRAGNEFRCGST